VRASIFILTSLGLCEFESGLMLNMKKGPSFQMNLFHIKRETGFEQISAYKNTDKLEVYGFCYLFVRVLAHMRGV